MKFLPINIRGLAQVSDESLLSSYQQTEDKQYITQLFGRYLDMIYGVTLRYTPSTSEAEDYCHAIYEKITVKALSSPIKNFRAWIYVLTKHYCLEQFRKINKKIKTISTAELMQSGIELHHIEEPYTEDPNLAHLDDCIEQLTRLQRLCVKKFYFEKKSYKVIAEEINNDLSQVRSFIQNGRRNLKKCIQSK